MVICMKVIFDVNWWFVSWLCWYFGFIVDEKVKDDDEKLIVRIFFRVKI